MTISIESIRSGPFTPNSVTTVFPFDFKVGGSTQVRVFQIVAGIDVDLSSALYSVSIAADTEGGTVSFATAPSTGSGAIYIESAPAFTESSNFSNAGFLPATVNPVVDRIMARLLWLRDRLSRALVVPRGSTVPTLPSFADILGMFLVVDAGGNIAGASGTGADGALRADLAGAGGAALIGTASGTLQDALNRIAVSAGARSIPTNAFSWVQIYPTLVNGVGSVSYSETPIQLAWRTINHTVEAETVWVSPLGDDAVGLGTETSPWREIDFALNNIGSTRVRAVGGRYKPFNLRQDISPGFSNRLRLIEALGQVDISHPTDDLSSNPITATQTVTLSGVPTAGDWVNIGGTIFTYRAAVVVPTDVLLGVDATANAVNLKTAVNLMASVATATATNLAGVVTLHSTLYGAAGNATALTKSGANIAVGAATFAGGRNTWLQTSLRWVYKLTPANFPPRAVFDHSRLEVETGLPTPMARYAPSRTFAFGSTQPLNNSTATINGIVYTFKTVVTGARQVLLGATTTDTATNFQNTLNAESGTIGAACDKPIPTSVRAMAILNAATQNVAASASGASPVVSALATGQDNLENLVFYDQVVEGGDNGGWFWDPILNELHLRRGNDNIEAHRADFELILSSANDADNRCLLYGSKVAVEGDVCWKGTYVFPLDYSDGTRSEFYGDFRHAPGRVTAMCTPAGAPFIQNSGCRVVVKDAIGYCSSIDTFHPDTTVLTPQTHLIDCESYFPGDPFTFPVVAFPNNNGASSHGVLGTMVIFSGVYHFSAGPDIASEGILWLVGVDAGSSVGEGAENSIYLLTGATAYCDTCNFTGGRLADVRATGNSKFYFYRVGYRTSDIEAGSSIIPWVPV